MNKVLLKPRVTAAALCGALSVWGGAAKAIYVRGDVDISNFNNLALNPAFAAAGFFTSGCSGVLVASDKVLTAGHCAGGITNESKFGFGANKADAQTAYSVSSVAVNPLYSSGDQYQYDLAIATLSNPVTGVTPATINSTINTTTLIGQEVTFIGYGAQGDGNDLALPASLLGANDRLGATNIIDGVPFNLWAADFDSPSDPTKNYFGSFFGSSSAPTGLEGNLAWGDSGGPLFWNNFLVGIGGYILTQPPTPTYGNASLWVRLDSKANLNFLQLNGISPAPVPLPPALWLLGSALFGLAGFRRNA